MCDKEVKKHPWLLIYIPDWFVTQGQIDLWHDDNNSVYNDDKLIYWHDGYKKRKARKAKIKEELMPIAWHPSRY